MRECSVPGWREGCQEYERRGILSRLACREYARIHRRKLAWVCVVFPALELYLSTTDWNGLEVLPEGVRTTIYVLDLVGPVVTMVLINPGDMLSDDCFAQLIAVISLAGAVATSRTTRACMWAMSHSTFEDTACAVNSIVATSAHWYFAFDTWRRRGVAMWSRLRSILLVFCAYRQCVVSAMWLLGATSYPPLNVSFLTANLVTGCFVLVGGLVTEEFIRQYIAAKMGFGRVHMKLSDLSSPEQEAALEFMGSGGVLMHETGYETEISGSFFHQYPDLGIAATDGIQRRGATFVRDTYSESTTKGGAMYTGPMDDATQVMKTQHKQPATSGLILHSNTTHKQEHRRCLRS